MVTSRVAFISKKAKNPERRKAFPRLHPVKRGQDIIANKADLYSLRSDVEGEATIKRVTHDRRQGAPRADRPDIARYRPDKAARLPVEMAAGEEGTVGY